MEVHPCHCGVYSIVQTSLIGHVASDVKVSPQCTVHTCVNRAGVLSASLRVTISCSFRVRYDSNQADTTFINRR